MQSMASPEYTTDKAAEPPTMACLMASVIYAFTSGFWLVSAWAAASISASFLVLTE